MQLRRHTRVTRVTEVSTVKVIAVRFAVVAATTGILGAVTAPAHADTGWNRQIVRTAPAHPAGTST